MGFLYQLPAIVGGTVLVIERIESQNFQPGVFGWAIYANGDAEFNNLVIRGSGVFGPSPGKHVDINLTYPGAIGIFTGEVTEAQSGLFGPDSAGSGELRTTMRAPQHVATAHVAEVVALTNSANQSLIYLNAEFISVFGLMTFESWSNIPLTGTWVDLAGARANYFMDPTGRVQLRGEVISGGAALVGTMPVGRRPTQTMEWIMRGVGGVIMCAVSVSTTGAITVTANAATAQASGIRLDSISYPTI